MRHKINKHTLFFVKKKQIKQGDIWNNLVNQRLHEQHPSEMSDDDHHAIPKIVNPILEAAAEEAKKSQGALDDLEKEITHLKEKDEEKREPRKEDQPPVPPAEAWYDDL